MGSGTMSSGTMKSVALGVGVAGLLIAVGVGSFFMARGDSGSTTADPVPSTGADGLDDGTVDGTVDGSSTTSTTEAPTGPQVLESTSTTTEPPVREFAELFEISRAAVGSVTAVTCNTTRQGTAFLVDDTIVYTAASVIADAAEVVVAIDSQSIEATVLGRDPERNIATLELSEPVTGVAPLEFSTSQARVGVEVAALVQPVGLPQTLTIGRLTSIDATQPSTLLRTDAVVELGSSGGPMIDARGQVVGIVLVNINDAGEVAGPLAAVASADIREQLAGWIATPEPPSEAFCVGNVDLSEIDAVAGELIAADTDHPEIAAIQRTYAVYSQSINSSRAENAFGVLGPAITNTSDPVAWAEGQRTSKLWDSRIREVNNTTSGLQVRSVFTSTQDGEFGFDGSSTCTRWDITHNLVDGTFRGQPYWLINRSRATEGSGPVDCLDWQPERVARETFATESNSSIRRSDFLAGGTIHVWTIDVGEPLPAESDNTTPEADEDESGPVEPAPVVFTVQVEADGGFDPHVEVYNAANELVAENDDADEGTTNSSVSITVSSPETMAVVVRDLSDRSGGDYVATFTTSTG